MATMTFNDWAKVNPTMVGRSLHYAELPIIELNPIVIKLWREKYATTPLHEFLSNIQSSRYTDVTHRNIKKDLKSEGVKTWAVGSGQKDEELFYWISNHVKYNNSYNINDYLEEQGSKYKSMLGSIDSSNRLTLDPTYTLRWNNWWFAPNLFVFNVGSVYPFINWGKIDPIIQKN